MGENHYNNKEKHSLISLNKSSYTIQRMLGKCFEFIFITEGYINDPTSDLTTTIGLNESRVFFFSHPDKRDLRISLLIGNISLSQTMLTVFVIDDTDTLSDEEQKQLNVTFSNALFYYLNNTLVIKNHREKVAANGCVITYIVFIISFLIVFYG